MAAAVKAPAAKPTTTKSPAGKAKPAAGTAPKTVVAKTAATKGKAAAAPKKGAERWGFRGMWTSCDSRSGCKGLERRWRTAGGRTHLCAWPFARAWRLYGLACVSHAHQLPVRQAPLTWERFTAAAVDPKLEAAALRIQRSVRAYLARCRVYKSTQGKAAMEAELEQLRAAAFLQQVAYDRKQADKQRKKDVEARAKKVRTEGGRRQQQRLR